MIPRTRACSPAWASSTLVTAAGRGVTRQTPTHPVVIFLKTAPPPPPHTLTYTYTYPHFPSPFQVEMVLDLAQTLGPGVLSSMAQRLVDLLGAMPKELLMSASPKWLTPTLDRIAALAHTLLTSGGGEGAGAPPTPGPVAVGVALWTALAVRRGDLGDLLLLVGHLLLVPGPIVLAPSAAADLVAMVAGQRVQPLLTPPFPPLLRGEASVPRQSVGGAGDTRGACGACVTRCGTRMVLRDRGGLRALELGTGPGQEWAARVLGGSPCFPATNDTPGGGGVVALSTDHVAVVVGHEPRGPVLQLVDVDTLGPARGFEHLRLRLTPASKWVGCVAKAQPHTCAA